MLAERSGLSGRKTSKNRREISIEISTNSARNRAKNSETISRDSGEMPVAVRRNSAQKLAGRHARAERSPGRPRLAIVGASSQKLSKAPAPESQDAAGPCQAQLKFKEWGVSSEIVQNFFL